MIKKKIPPQIVAIRQLVNIICKDKVSINMLIKAQKEAKKKNGDLSV